MEGSGSESCRRRATPLKGVATGLAPNDYRATPHFCYHTRMESQLYPALFVLTPTALGIALLLVIWYRRGRQH